jgi:hypothetical protein
MVKLLLSIAVFIFFNGYIVAKSGPGSNIISPANAGCSPSSSSADLDIGNVRAKIFINGDMWWDLSSDAKYEVPKGSGLHSLFTGAIWIGGRDGSGNLKTAAQTYRQSGSDFWPGPIDTVTVDVSAATCSLYNQHWKVTRHEVFNFANGASATPAIMNWPGNGNPANNESNFLAPFYDNNADGIYDYLAGDYPKYEFGIQSTNLYNRLNGDQTIWWVFNDVGNAHGETMSAGPIGLEIRAQAYAFCTSDSDLSNTTFYSYQIIHRSPTMLFEVHIGQFVDVDLGNFTDDYIGCDVSRNMGYGYNGDIDDDGSEGYGTVLPAVGVDLLDITMDRFHYYNNDGSVTGNPATSQHHYNYMDGKWKDGFPVVYGGTGYPTGSGDTCRYMFPGDSDPTNIGTYGVDPGFNWSESNTTIGGLPNAPGDRRFIMSSGDFALLPGEVKYFTTAAVWARAAGGIDSSLAALKRADDKIQSFFDSSFNTISTCLLALGTNEIKNIPHSIYPSPASDYFIINLPENNQHLEINIYSSEGKLINSLIEKKSTQIIVNSQEWKSGIYYYNLKMESGEEMTGKIVIIN